MIAPNPNLRPSNALRPTRYGLPGPDRAAVLAYVQRWADPFEDPGNEFAHIQPRTPGRVGGKAAPIPGVRRFLPCSDTEAIADALCDHVRRGWDPALSLNPIHRRYATGPAVSSRRSDVSAVYYVGASIDVGSMEPHATREEAQREILHLCEAWGLGAPYLVTWSGRGAHVIWRLSEPAGLGVHDGCDARVELTDAATLAGWIACRLQGDKSGAGATSTIRPHGTWNLKDPGNPLPVELVSLDLAAGVVATSHPGRFGRVDLRHSLTLAEAEGEDALHAYWSARYAMRPGTGLEFRPLTTTAGGGRSRTPEEIAALPLAVPEPLASYVKAMSGGHFREKRVRAEDGSDRVAGVILTRRAPCCLHDGKAPKATEATAFLGRYGRATCRREGCGANVDGGLSLVEYATRYTPDLLHLVTQEDVRRVDVRTDGGRAAVLASVRGALDFASAEGEGPWIGLEVSEPGTGKTTAALHLVAEAIKADPSRAHVLAVDAYETGDERVKEARALGIDVELVVSPFHPERGGCLRREAVASVGDFISPYSQCRRCPVYSSCPVVEDRRPTPATGRLYVVVHDYAPAFLAFARKRGVPLAPGWWDEVPSDERITSDVLTTTDLETVIKAADSARGGGTRFANLGRWGERWAHMAERLRGLVDHALYALDTGEDDERERGTIDAADLRAEFARALGGEARAREVVASLAAEVDDVDREPPTPEEAWGPDRVEAASRLRDVLPRIGTTRRMLDALAGLAGLDDAPLVSIETRKEAGGPPVLAYVLRRPGVGQLTACVGPKGDGPLARWVVLAATFPGNGDLDAVGIPAPADRIRRMDPLGPVVDAKAVHVRFLRTGRHTLTRKRLLRPDRETLRDDNRRGVNVALREALARHPAGESFGILTYAAIARVLRDGWTIATDGRDGGDVAKALARFERRNAGHLLPELEAAALVIPPDRFIVRRHFHHARGSNAYGDVRTLLVLGRPIRNVGGVRADAAAAGVDPERWARACEADEMAQTIERGRGGRRGPDNPLDLVVVGSHFPDLLTRYRPEVLDLPRYQGSDPLPVEASPEPDPAETFRAYVEDHATRYGGTAVVGLEHLKALESGFVRLLATNTYLGEFEGPTARESRKMGLCAVPGVLGSVAASFGVLPATVRAVVEAVGKARGWVRSTLPLDSGGRPPSGWAPAGSHADYLARVVAEPVPFSVEAVDASGVPAAVDAVPESMPEPAEAWDLEAGQEPTIREPITADEYGPAVAGALAKGATMAELGALVESVRATVRGTGLVAPDLGFAAWVVSRCPPWREWFGTHPEAIPWERFPTPSIDPPPEVAGRYSPGEWAARVSRWIEAARGVVWIDADSRW